MKIKISLLLAYSLILASLAHSQDSTDVLKWKLKHEIRDVVKVNNDFNKGIKLFEELYNIESSYSSGHWRLATVCYDKIGRIDKSIELMKEMKSRGDSTFCYKDYGPIREYSDVLQSNKEFCELCKLYDYAIKFPCDYSEYRDSLVKYLILEGPLDKAQEVFVVMGYESYYDSLSNFKSMSWHNRVNYSSKKIDSLTSIYGYPSIDKVIDSKIEFLAGLSFIHSGDLERYIYYIEHYSNEMSPQDFAYISDKIAVKTNTPQEYGTQIVVGEDGANKLYPIQGDLKMVNRKRMQKDLEPLESYLSDFGIILTDF